jgi:large subunit ribosomal protein L23
MSTMKSLDLLDLVSGPHLTEKATRLASDHRQYVFKVRSAANKADVRRAVEMLFGVQVARVTLLNQPGKSKRQGGRTGWRSGFKKAYVCLAPGQNLDLGGGVESP